MNAFRWVMVAYFVGALYLVFEIPEGHLLACRDSLRHRFNAATRTAFADSMLILGAVLVGSTVSLPGRRWLVETIAPALVLAVAAMVATDNLRFWHTRYRQPEAKRPHP